MILNVIINDQTHPVEVPDEILSEAEALFQKMDRDMDRGWQMSRDWVDRPDPLQRCQIVADKMLTAIEKDERKVAAMMAGYILKRLPGVSRVDVDTTGDMNQTEIVVEQA